MKKILLNIAFIFIFSNIINAQISSDSLDLYKVHFENKSLNTSFIKDLNTSNFNAGFKYNIQNEKLFIGLSETFFSTVVNSISKNIKDEHYLSALGEYDLNNSLKIGLQFKNDIYSDDRKLAINNAARVYSSFYGKWVISNEIKLTPYAGFAVNKQIGEYDKGYIYGSEILVDKYKFEDFTINSFLRFQNEDISPRKNTIRNVTLNLNNKFEQQFQNNINAHFSEVRKDFYFEADSMTSSLFNVQNNIQSRSEVNYHLYDNINYSSGDNKIDLNFLGKVGWRKIDRNTRYRVPSLTNSTNYDSQIEEFKINFDASARYKTDRLYTMFKLSFAELEEKYRPKNLGDLNQIFVEQRKDNEAEKNNSAQLITLSLNGAYNLSGKDVLTASFYHRKMTYDTPSETNYDDRDELLSIVRINYDHKFSKFFNLFVNLEGSINHIVYIFSERSSNNNIRRLIKLSSGGTYRSTKLTSTNSAEVSANYTVYDFEDINPNYKSFSFRQLTLKDSSRFRLTQKTALTFYGSAKFSEQGDFAWGQFKNKPVRYLTELLLEPRLVYNFRALTLGVGFRYFGLTTYGYNKNNVKQKASEYKSRGPVSNIRYRLNSKLEVYFNGWYSFISTDNRERESANLTLRMNWFL
ncbi:MAG: hypothetical protein JEY94_08460 [Melioribacteraceae bacterium]|nr:hypothetical protein [Melioribacteraceae bacterium]